MDEQDIGYALAKQVPNMRSRGFIIGTSYGELTIESGPATERIADAVQKALECELKKLQKVRKPKAEPTKAAAAPDYFDRTLMGAKP